VLSPARFRELHRPGDPLLLPNAWDLASALTLAAHGAEVVGTTSLGVAVAAGEPDGAGATLAPTIELAHRITAAGIAVTVDLEAGFSDDPVAVGDVVAELARAGVVGVNLEDSTAQGLTEPVAFARKLAAVAAAAPELYLNARTDAFWVGALDGIGARTSASLERARRYLDAGATGVFVPGTLDDGTIATLASGITAPLNVLAQPGRAIGDLAALGVARISTGSLLFRASLAAITTVLDDVRLGAPPGTTARSIPDYSAAVALGVRRPSPG
jgi:2-methylisocitrate lyase-like PEP mutase family enzyme